MLNAKHTHRCMICGFRSGRTPYRRMLGLLLLSSSTREGKNQPNYYCWLYTVNSFTLCRLNTWKTKEVSVVLSPYNGGQCSSAVLEIKWVLFVSDFCVTPWRIILSESPMRPSLSSTGREPKTFTSMQSLRSVWICMFNVLTVMYDGAYISTDHCVKYDTLPVSCSQTVRSTPPTGGRRKRCAITWSVPPNTEITWRRISWNRRSSTFWPISMERGAPCLRGIHITSCLQNVLTEFEVTTSLSHY